MGVGGGGGGGAWGNGQHLSKACGRAHSGPVLGF